MGNEKIIRVFVRRTNATPDDSMAFVGDPLFPDFLPTADEVHVSCTFTWDKGEAERLERAWEIYFPGKVKLGGPAYDDKGGEFVVGRYLKKGYVITTRGCPNLCPWCFVPQREGELRTLSIMEGNNVLDNNLLAAPKEHIEAVFKMLRKQRRGAQFTGGLDARLLNDWHIDLLKSIRVKQIFLAYDHRGQWPCVVRSARMLRNVGYDREKLRCYVMVGYQEDTIEQALARLEAVWEIGLMPFVMLFEGGGRRAAMVRDGAWRELVREWSLPAIMRAKHRKKASKKALGIRGEALGERKRRKEKIRWMTDGRMALGRNMNEKQEMKVRTLVAWFGGKRTLAPKIVGELGSHSMYVEPFCGSMAVLLAKKRCSHEIVNDLYGDLINLARVIASDRWEELYNRLYRTLCAEEIFDECKVKFLAGDLEPAKTIGDVGDEHVERAYIYFVVSWMGRGGVCGTKRQNYQLARRWKSSGGSGGRRFASAVDSMRAWHERLRGVSIMNMDGFKLIEKVFDDARLVMYVDPPYLMGGARTGGNGSGAYKHEFTQEDHGRLAKLLGRFEKARVIVSCYNDERLEKLYPLAKWERRKVFKKKSVGFMNGGGYTQTEAPEVLLLNGESLAEKEERLFE